jgi:hypothetical protein
MDTGAGAEGRADERTSAPQSPLHTVHDDDDYDHNNDGLLPLWKWHIYATSSEPYFGVHSQKQKHGRQFEDELTRKNDIFWDVTPCGSCKTDVSEELSTPFIRVTKISELFVRCVGC